MASPFFGYQGKVAARRKVVPAFQAPDEPVAAAGGGDAMGADRTEAPTATPKPAAKSAEPQRVCEECGGKVDVDKDGRAVGHKVQVMTGGGVRDTDEDCAGSGQIAEFEA